MGKGIDTRQSGVTLEFAVSLKDLLAAKVTTGTTSLRLFEVQPDGSLKAYDFADNTFKTTALTTATLAMTHRTGDNGTYNTGIWTATLSDYSGFTRGRKYISQFANSNASPPEQERMWQYGDGEGDLSVDATGKVNAQTVGIDAGQLDAIVDAWKEAVLLGTITLQDALLLASMGAGTIAQAGPSSTVGNNDNSVSSFPADDFPKQQDTPYWHLTDTPTSSPFRYKLRAYFASDGATFIGRTIVVGTLL